MPKISEGKFVIGSLVAFSIWIFVALPILYLPPDQTDYRRPPITKEQAEPSKAHNQDANQDRNPASVALTRGTPADPLYVQPTCDENDRNAECNKGWWQKLWTDPVATFTGALFLATFFQTFFTWRAFIESRKANENARTAELNTASAIVISNRPYVFVRQFMPLAIGDPANPIGWQCIVVWENSGATPTQNLRMWVSWAKFENPIPPNYPFPDFRDTRGDSATVIPPRGQVTTSVFVLDREHALALAEGRYFTYIWGWAEYSDIFPNTPKRRTEFCVQIVATRIQIEPIRLLIEFRNHYAHNSAT